MSLQSWVPQYSEVSMSVLARNSTLILRHWFRAVHL